MRLFKAGMLVNIFFILVICYLAYHLVYGKFNIQNYLAYKFEEKIWKQKQETLGKVKSFTDVLDRLKNLVELAEAEGHNVKQD